MDCTGYYPYDTGTGTGDYGGNNTYDEFENIAELINQTQCALVDPDYGLPIEYGPRFNTERNVVIRKVLQLQGGCGRRVLPAGGSALPAAKYQFRGRGRCPVKVLYVKRKRNRG